MIRVRNTVFVSREIADNFISVLDVNNILNNFLDLLFQLADLLILILLKHFFYTRIKLTKTFFE
jgi:hypothetical protein